jgi:CheY-like chemotaxis protein
MAIAKVLVVDDAPDLLRIARFSLQTVGKWEVAVCSAAGEAAGAARREKPDAILLDVQMPGLGGPEVLAQLRHEPSTCAIPVIFMTATADEGEVQRLLDLGACGVLFKPLDPFGLPKKIAALVAAAPPRTS